MKKETINRYKETMNRYNETNFKKSRLYKEYKRRRRKEKICRFMSLPTVLWTIVFLIASLVLLYLSFRVNESNPWLSGVLVSFTCGIITGVILYFLSNLRNNKLHVLQAEQDEIYPIYKLVSDVLEEKTSFDNFRRFDTYGTTVQEQSDAVMDKLYQLFDSFDSANVLFLARKEGLKNLYNNVVELSDNYETLHDDNDREKWVSDVNNKLEPIKRKMEILMAENGDQIGFIKKYIF